MADGSDLSVFLSNSALRLGQALDDAIGTALAPRPDLLPSEWAEEYLYLPRVTTSKPGKLELFPFQRGPLDALVEPNVEEIVIEKASRTGFTQLMAIMELYCLEQTSSPVVSIHPKEASSRSFERRYIRPMVDASPTMRAVFPDMEKQPWKSKMSATGSTLDFKDAVLPDNFAEYSARCIFGDEVDRPQWAPGGDATSEGDKIFLMSKRLESFDDGVMVLGSSPGTDKASRIHPRFLMTDQRRYFVPCPHCGEYQWLKWGGRGTDFGVKWPKDRPEDAYYVCEHNGCVIEHKSLLGMVQQGEWRPTAEGLPGRIGFHMPALLSPYKRASWGALAVNFVKATREASVGNTDSLQAFINTSLGEVWEEPDAGRQAEPHELEERREMYDAEVPSDCLFVLGASDQQQGGEGEPGYSEVSFYGVAPGEQLWHLGHFVVRAGGLDDPAHWEKMSQLLSRKWKFSNGREMEAFAISLDTGGASQKVMDFCNRWQRKGKKWWPIQGYSNRQGKRRPPMWPASPSQSKHGGKLYTIDTYIAKDTMFDRLQREPGEPGSIHFPTASIPSDIEGVESHPCDATFFKRLTRERPKPLRGHPGVTTWEKQPKDQEPWDDLYYTYATLHGVYAMKGGSKIQEALQISAKEYAEIFEAKADREEKPQENTSAPEPDRKPRPWEKPREPESDKPKPQPSQSGPQVVRSSFMDD